MTIITNPASLVSAAFGAVAGRVRVARSRNARRVALLSLLDMDAHRLDDLGITLGDVRDALGRSHHA